ncbi:UPF0158 family protein [uncultured Ferrimonas sp.]|uniref:UPF0158 family protein n=1 Tax=uncultured Ferrimonas sp. TaxID=432640 RepID=UPI00261AA7A2|nr:UPF0158 family protein [uncultured Ferrimonas sp.]
MTITVSRLLAAVAQVSTASLTSVAQVEGYLCVENGAIYFDNEANGALPDDVDDWERYLEIPSYDDLDLGIGLRYRFIEHHGQEWAAELTELLQGAGSLQQFDQQLQAHALGPAWQHYQQTQSVRALQEWAAELELKLRRG